MSVQTAQAPSSEQGTHPPMLCQYLGYKERCPDCLVLFQVGDFYEVFFDDAVTVAKALNLTLTTRDRNSPNPVPMCGVPIAVVEGYVERLVAAGYSVALISQIEGTVGSKGGVQRVLERVVTPGVQILAGNESALGSSLCAIVATGRDEVAWAFTDVQSGEVVVREGVLLSDLIADIDRLQVAEIILAREMGGRELDQRTPWVRTLASHRSLKIRALPPVVDDSKGIATAEGFLSLGPIGRRAVRLLAAYVEEVTVTGRAQLKRVGMYRCDEVVHIDSATRLNLELIENVRERSEEGTLYQFLNTTCTVAGSRLLRSWVSHPLIVRERIEDRLDAVESLQENRAACSELRDQLRLCCDLQRLASRVELSVIAPRELGALRSALEALPNIQRSLGHAHAHRPARLFEHLFKRLSVPEGLLSLLTAALVDEPPAHLKNGGVFRAGYRDELDRLRQLRDSGGSWFEEYEREQRARTGIASLKVRSNGVFGYFIEVTKANLEKVPNDYRRRQTTANSERFTTEELDACAREVLSADARMVALEKELFEELRAQVLPFSEEMRGIGAAIAEVDALQSFAAVAERDHLVRPEIGDDRSLAILGGRHPVLSRLLGEKFIPNTSQFIPGERECIIVTGPNMGGKSTYLRQVALITLLAQMGSFVPAQSAHIGIVDRVFARIGASDDLREGESTFMVEMRETAQILRQATERSLVLIDEIGRGTATADGLAIARAVAEWLAVQARCRTLFATHFHELTSLTSLYSNMDNECVRAIEEGDRVLFTHHIHRGAADRSYGIDVAVLAGLPEAVVHRARELLEFERANDDGGQKSHAQLGLPLSASFTKRSPAVPPGISEILRRIGAISINDTTPREALNVIEELQLLLRREGGE